MRLIRALASLVPLVAQISSVAGFITCSVLDYGGVADNSTDLGPALLSAWNNCVIPKSTTTALDTLLYVPSGNYLLKTNVLFNHAANFNLHITGNIYIPFISTLTGTMIQFQNCDNIVLNGPGAIYGNGYRYRPGGDLSLYPSRPRLIRFQTCNNCEITAIRLYDAPMFHVTVIGDNNVAHDMSIVATNIGTTDGFDFSGNNNYVHDVSVENGDECVTVKSPTKNFVAERITCKYTAGCNIGSFGAGATGVDVENVYYKDVTITNSKAGILIKSYPDCAGTVKNITYEGFTFTAAAYPLEINSFWMGGTTDTGKLSITDVTFKDITGTGTSTRPLVWLNCNAATPCKNIKFSGISLSGGKADVFTNACGSGLTGIPSC